MNGLIGGFFGMTHSILDGFGRFVAFVLFGRKAAKAKASYSWVGGGTVGAVLGLFAAYVVNDGTNVWMLFAGCFGMLVGIVLGASIAAINRFIETVIAGDSSK